MKFILVLFIYGFGGATPAAIHQPYESKEACETAGNEFDRRPSFSEGGPIRTHVCITAPK